MIAKLKPIQRRAWLIGVGASTITVGLAGATYYVFINQGQQSTIALVAACVVALCASLFGSYFTAQSALHSTDFLARAILLADNDKANVDTPRPRDLRVGGDYLASLAQMAYRLGDAKGVDIESGSGLAPGLSAALLQTISLPIIAIDNHGNISYANESAARYLGHAHEHIVGQQFNDVVKLSFVSGLTLEMWMNESRQNTVTADEVWERVRLQVDETTRKQFDLAAHFSSDDSNGFETTLIFFDRTRVYEHDDRDLTFVSLAVHELRTPLTIMRGYIEVFEDELRDQLTHEQAEFMNNMSASAQQLSTFVSNILDVVRIDENALVISMKEENWGEVLMASCKDIGLRAQVHGKKLVFDIAKDLPTVAVSKVSIYEVINNLVDNAIKYTHTDEPIVISAYVKDGVVETTITDKGVGIPASLLAHIFDKFYRAHTSKNSVGGTGLGLYLSKAIVQAHGGTIWVTSKEGQGSTFGFTLPIYANVANDLRPEQNGEIVRGAHGWIKNHTLYRG